MSIIINISFLLSARLVLLEINNGLFRVLSARYFTNVPVLILRFSEVKKKFKTKRYGLDIIIFMIIL